VAGAVPRPSPPAAEWTLVFNSDAAGAAQAGLAVHSVVQVADCMGEARTGLSNLDLLAYVRVDGQDGDGGGGSDGGDESDGGGEDGMSGGNSVTAAGLQTLLRLQMPALFADTEVTATHHQHRWRGACSVSPVGPITAEVRGSGLRQGLWFAGDVFGGFPYHMEHACESGYRAAQELMDTLRPRGPR